MNEAHVMVPLLESHQANTGRGAEAVVGDSKYGTIENFLACHDRGIEAHIPDLKVNQVKGVIKGVIQPISGKIKDFMLIETNGIMPLAFARVQFRET